MSLLIARGELLDGRRVDVRMDEGVVVEIGDRLRPRFGEGLIDARGGALIPGLHDHHVHLWAAAAADASVRVGPPEVRTMGAFAAALRQAHLAAAPHEWLRAYGYHESVAGRLDRDVLDAIVPNRPVRVQHRSGALWILNSAAIARTSLDRAGERGIERERGGRPTGRLWRMDAWIRRATPPVRADLATLSARAASLGVTGYTDATPHRVGHDIDALTAVVDSGEVKQRLCLMCPVGEQARADHRLVSTGPVKFILDDDDLPELHELIDDIVDAHLAARTVAVHCTTQLQLIFCMAALRHAGSHPGDRVEHGSVIAAELIADLRDLGVVIVTQPNFVYERGDEYLSSVDASDQGSLYRCGSLLRNDVPVAAGTDAPFGRLDPWSAMTAAVDRRTAGERTVTPDESVSPLVALQLFLGSAKDPGTPRTIEEGATADVAVLGQPVRELLPDLGAASVVATIVAGEPIFTSTGT